MDAASMQLRRVMINKTGSLKNMAILQTKEFCCNMFNPERRINFTANYNALFWS